MQFSEGKKRKIEKKTKQLTGKWQQSSFSTKDTVQYHRVVLPAAGGGRRG